MSLTCNIIFKNKFYIICIKLYFFPFGASIVLLWGLDKLIYEYILLRLFLYRLILLYIYMLTTFTEWTLNRGLKRSYGSGQILDQWSYKLPKNF